MQKSRKIVCASPVDLDKNLSVRMVLKDLKLDHLIEAFEKHEVSVNAFARKYCSGHLKKNFNLTLLFLVVGQPGSSLLDVGGNSEVYRCQQCSGTSRYPRVHSRLQNTAETEEDSQQAYLGSQRLLLVKLEPLVFSSTQSNQNQKLFTHNSRGKHKLCDNFN